MCIFTNVDPEDTLALLNHASGKSYELTDLLLAGERAWNLKRVINFGLGLRRCNDNLPAVFLKLHTDFTEESKTTVPDFNAMMNAYYYARGWNPKSGYPVREKLESLNLIWTIKDQTAGSL